jgi:hypothetical protein
MGYPKNYEKGSILCPPLASIIKGFICAASHGCFGDMVDIIGCHAAAQSTTIAEFMSG